MVGRNVENQFPKKEVPIGEEILRVEHITNEYVNDASFVLKKGEILGFSGLVGAGRSEVMQAIFGYLPVYKGSVNWTERTWKLGDTTIRLEWIIYLPEERKSRGFASTSIEITFLCQFG